MDTDTDTAARVGAGDPAGRLDGPLGPFGLVAAAAFARVDRRAALPPVPYLAWVAFAGPLNHRVRALN